MNKHRTWNHRIPLNLATVCLLSLAHVAAAVEDAERIPATQAAPKENNEWTKRYWFPAHEQNVKETRTRQGRPLDIILLGDSIAHGFRGREGRDALAREYPTVNMIIEAYADGSTVFWQDISDQFLNEDGSLSETVFAKDLLHINGKGYITWATAMKPMVQRLLSAK